MRKAMPTGLLVLFFLAALPAAAQTGPLSQNDIIQMAQAKTPVEKIITQVRARGIAFVPSAELETTLTQLKVKKEHLQQLMAALRAPAAIELTANVAGGEVTLDGAPRGELSADGRIAFRDLSPGTHVIRLRARGHVPVNTDVFLKPGETAQVNLKLDSAVSATPGPLGTRVNVQAGTFEDTALAELDFEKDPAKRIERLEKIVATYGDDPFTLLAYGMLQDAYLAASNYDRALAAGQTLLERDPRNFAGTVRQARASMGRQELEPALAHAARARSLIEELKAGPAPDNLSAEAWERERQALLETAQPQLDSLTYDLLIAASDHPDPAAKTVLLERFLATFPDSPYRRSAFLTLALTAQGLGDLDRMLHWATQGLELDPNQGFLIVIVADTLSERGQDLARARELASRLLDLVSNQPDKLRPEGIDDAQWQGQRQLWEGLAHSILGQVLMHEGAAQPGVETAKTQEAIKAFQAASTALQAASQQMPAATVFYARNLYRLGFAHAKLAEFVPARRVLTEAVSLETPYQQPARELLEKVQQRIRR